MPGSSAPDHPPMLGAVQVVPPRSLRSLRGLHLDRPCASANLARMEEPGNNEHPSDQLDLRDNPASIKPGAVQTGSAVGAGAANSTPSSAAVAASTASTRSATATIRRSHPRTVEHGTLTNTAIRRCPAPPALASSAAPITVTASARRSNTLAGNSTWVRRHPRHLPRRGRNRPAPRTARSRAQPHGRSCPPQSANGQPNNPAHREFSTAAPSSPTVITGAPLCTKTALPCPPRHAEGPSPTSRHHHPDVAHHRRQDPNRPGPRTAKRINPRRRSHPQAAWRSTARRHRPWLAHQAALGH